MKIEAYQSDRTALLPLFRLADDSAAQIRDYLNQGVVLVARDAAAMLGHIQIIETDVAGSFEIKSLAVGEQCQGQGIGTRLIEAAIALVRAQHGHRVIVATATADIDNLRFYQRRGFRMSHIARDIFVPANGYPDDLCIDGIPLRDQIFLDLDLNG